MSTPLLMRKWHRWGAVLAALPLLVVVASGLLLQLKKQVDWIQPPTRSGTAAAPAVGLDDILAGAVSVEEAGIASWDDVARLDVRPGLGIVKVRAKSRWEVQIDTATGAVLQAAYRRSDFIESLHDGSFFHDNVKLFVFLPAGVLLLGLWATGVYLWWLPHGVRRRKRRAQTSA